MAPRNNKSIKNYTRPVDLLAFQITEEDVNHCPNFGNKNIGKWGFMLDGCYSGFFSTKEKAEKWIKELEGKVY
jgi:hypothetical protein